MVQVRRGGASPQSRSLVPTSLLGTLGLLALGALVSMPLLAQERGAQNGGGLQERVDELVEQLSAEDHAERDAAQEELSELPPEALERLRGHLERAEDPELMWRLSEAIDALLARHPEAEEEEEPQPEPRVEPRRDPDAPQFRFRMRPGQDQFQGSSIVVDREGRWQLEARDGRLTVSFTPRGAEEPAETREFESYEQLQEEWPEAAQRFRGFFREPRGRVLPPLREPGEDEPQPGPFDDDLFPGGDDLLERLLDDLMEGGGGMLELDELLEDMQRRAEEMQRRAEELQRESERRFERFRRGEEREEQGNPLNDLLRRLFDGTLEDDLAPGEDAPEPRSQRRERGVEPRGVIGTIDGTEFRAVPPAIRAQLQLGESEGLLVERVGETGPLTEAGIQRFDLLLAIDGKTVESLAGVRRSLEALPEGAEFTVTVVRRAERVQLIGTKE